MESLERRMAEHLARHHVLDHGVADLSGEGDHLTDLTGEDYANLPRALSIAVRFPSTIIDLLEKGPSRTYLYFFREVNNRLNRIALEIDSLLASEGYRSFPVPASRREGKERVASIFPHRLAARLAGLGWIGKSGLLIRRDVGPRLRLITVLTDAPLSPATQPVEDGCGSCTACIEACPAGAFAERETSPDWRGNRVDPLACDRYLARVRDRHGIRVCGRCLVVCPFGRPGDGVKK